MFVRNKALDDYATVRSGINDAAIAHTRAVKSPPLPAPVSQMVATDTTGYGDRPMVAGPAPKSAPAAQSVAFTKGRKGDDVRALQTSLGHIATMGEMTDLDPGVADADFGKNTFDAVKAYQKYANLEITGIVDAETAASIHATEQGMMGTLLPLPAPSSRAFGGRAHEVGAEDDEMARTSEVAAMYAGNRGADARKLALAGETDIYGTSSTAVPAEQRAMAARRLAAREGTSAPYSGLTLTESLTAPNPTRVGETHRESRIGKFDDQMLRKVEQAAMTAGIEQADLRGLLAALGYPQS